MPSIDYSDLPDWIRPGAKLAVLSSCTLVVVTKITRTQIIARWSGGTDATYRFDRTPVPAKLPYRPEPEYRLRGTHSGHLVQRSHPEVIDRQIDVIARNAVEEADAARRVYGNPKANNDPRSRAERAMDLIDAVENAARKARRQIERLTDPGGMLAAEHAQDLTTTPEG